MTTRSEEANVIVNKYMNWAFAGGLVPLPWVDALAVYGVQTKMLYDLSKLYELEYKKNVVKSLVGALFGAGVPEFASLGLVGSGLKMIPVVGTTLGVIAMPVLSYAATCAVGRVFIQHFESGGTFLNFNPDAVRDHFRAEFESAQGEGRKSRAATT